MHRLMIAVAAVLLLFGAGAIWFTHPEAEGPLAFCWRMGVLLAAFWLAYDDLQRLPNWFLVLAPILLIVLVRWPRLLLMAIPVLVLYSVWRRVCRPEGCNRKG